MTDKTDRTARRHFNLLIFNLLTVAATAATCTPATTNDYYYTRPSTTNIFGRVMGENADYRLVRQEDLCWLNEAWVERLALAGGTTNGLAVAPLVKYFNAPWLSLASSEFWTTNQIPAAATMVTNQYVSDKAFILGQASDWKLTNIEVRCGLPDDRMLVSLRTITNEFATIRSMSRLVEACSPATTGKVKRVWRFRYTSDESRNPPPYEYESYTTNDVSALEWSSNISAQKSKSSEYIYSDGQYELWEVTVTTTESGDAATYGSATVEMAWDATFTNAWLRGEASPRVLDGVTALGAVKVSGSRSEYYVRETFDDGAWSEETLVDTNEQAIATVLLPLGTPRWIGVADGKMTYALDLAPGEWGPRAAAAATAAGVPSESEISGISPPDVTGDAGQHGVSAAVSAELFAVYLVLDLRPLSWVDGW